MTLTQTIHTEEELFEKARWMEIKKVLNGEQDDSQWQIRFLKASHQRILQAVILEIEGMMLSPTVTYSEITEAENAGHNYALSTLKTTLIEAIEK